MTDRHDDRPPGEEPPEERTEDDLVEEASKDSFPASDPPAVWNRPESEDDEGKD